MRSHIRGEDMMVSGTWRNGQLTLEQARQGWRIARRQFMRISDGRAW